MIQRIQSLFLLFSAIFSLIIVFYFPVLKSTEITIYLTENISYARLCVFLSVGLNIFSIFQFRNRNRQIIINQISKLFLSIAFIIIIFQRGELNFAIVDEVDSILIDEARTPLVISGQSNTSVEIYPKINSMVKLFKDTDYEINEENKSVLLSIEGMEFAEKLLLENGLIQGGTLQDLDNMSLNHNLIQALRAQKLFLKDKDYIIKDKTIIIIDELSGRPLEGRRYGDGLHQTIEAKEGLVIQQESQTIASITYQNFFRTYKKLSGMTGTALTEAAEFEGIYNLNVATSISAASCKRCDLMFFNSLIFLQLKSKKPIHFLDIYC